MENDRLSTTKLSSHLYHVIYMTCSMVDWKRYNRHNRHDHIRHLKNTLFVYHENLRIGILTHRLRQQQQQLKLKSFFLCLFILLLVKIGFPHWFISFSSFRYFFFLSKHLKHKSRKMFPQILIRFHKLCEINIFFLVFFTERNIDGWIFKKTAHTLVDERQ